MKILPFQSPDSFGSFWDTMLRNECNRMLCRSSVWMVSFVICLTAVVSAQDAIDRQLFSPEWLMQHRPQLKLTDDQARSIVELVQQKRPEIERGDQAIREARTSLEKTLSFRKIDEPQTMQAFEKLSRLEGDVRRLQFGLMVQLRTLLTPEQRVLASQLKMTPQANGNVQRRLQAKMARLQAELQKRGATGQPPTQVVRWMEPFSQLMQQGKIREAEDRLNRALRMVDLDPNAIAPAVLKPSEPSFPKREIPPLVAQSAAEIRQQAQGLKRQDVPWRKIAWKTSLLDGLKASRDENKPIILWVFIDRPIDDERC